MATGEEKIANLFKGDFVKNLKNRIRFTPIGGPYGDSTCDFKVLIPDGTTVGDVIRFALTQDEWGDVYVWCCGARHRLEYKRGTVDDRKGSVVSDGIPDHIKAMKVKEIVSKGGWSRMDYFIEV